MNAAGEEWGEGEKRIQYCQVFAVEYLHVRPCAGAWRGNNIRVTVAIQVASRHPHAASERWSVGEKALEYRAGFSIEYAHIRPAARARPGHDVQWAAILEFSQRVVDTAQEFGIVSIEIQQHLARLATGDLHKRRLARYANLDRI